MRLAFMFQTCGHNAITLINAGAARGYVT